jgi:hypothetical protein
MTGSVTVTLLRPVHPLEMTEQERENATHGSQDRSLNRRRVDGAPIELVLEWDVRNAGRKFLPQRLSVTVIPEESRRPPYCIGGKFVYSGPWAGKNILCTRRLGLYKNLKI